MALCQLALLGLGRLQEHMNANCASRRWAVRSQTVECRLALVLPLKVSAPNTCFQASSLQASAVLITGHQHDSMLAGMPNT